MSKLPKSLVDLNNFVPNCYVYDEPAIFLMVNGSCNEMVLVLYSDGSQEDVHFSVIRPLPTPQPWTIHQIMAHKGGFRLRTCLGEYYTIDQYKDGSITLSGVKMDFNYFIIYYVAVDANGVEHDMRGEG